jgi:hypothetical protein
MHISCCYFYIACINRKSLFFSFHINSCIPLPDISCPLNRTTTWKIWNYQTCFIIYDSYCSCFIHNMFLRINNYQVVYKSHSSFLTPDIKLPSLKTTSVWYVQKHIFFSWTKNNFILLCYNSLYATGLCPTIKTATSFIDKHSYLFCKMPTKC